MEELLSEVECATIMIIDPGVPATRFLSRALGKIDKVKTLDRRQGREIAVHVDGNGRVLPMKIELPFFLFRRDSCAGAPPA